MLGKRFDFEPRTVQRGGREHPRRPVHRFTPAFPCRERCRGFERDVLGPAAIDAQPRNGFDRAALARRADADAG
jgi:hypothetical protein